VSVHVEARPLTPAVNCTVHATLATGLPLVLRASAVLGAYPADKHTVYDAGLENSDGEFTVLLVEGHGKPVLVQGHYTSVVQALQAVPEPRHRSRP